jgi:hypothetical protein
MGLEHTQYLVNGPASLNLASSSAPPPSIYNGANGSYGRGIKGVMSLTGQQFPEGFITDKQIPWRKSTCGGADVMGTTICHHNFLQDPKLNVCHCMNKITQNHHLLYVIGYHAQKTGIHKDLDATAADWSSFAASVVDLECCFQTQEYLLGKRPIKGYQDWKVKLHSAMAAVADKYNLRLNSSAGYETHPDESPYDRLFKKLYQQFDHARAERALLNNLKAAQKERKEIDKLACIGMEVQVMPSTPINSSSNELSLMSVAKRSRERSDQVQVDQTPDPKTNTQLAGNRLNLNDVDGNQSSGSQDSSSGPAANIVSSPSNNASSSNGGLLDGTPGGTTSVAHSMTAPPSKKQRNSKEMASAANSVSQLLTLALTQHIEETANEKEKSKNTPNTNCDDLKYQIELEKAKAKTLKLQSRVLKEQTKLEKKKREQVESEKRILEEAPPKKTIIQRMKERKAWLIAKNSSSTDPIPPPPTAFNNTVVAPEVIRPVELGNNGVTMRNGKIVVAGSFPDESELIEDDEGEGCDAEEEDDEYFEEYFEEYD